MKKEKGFQNAKQNPKEDKEEHKEIERFLSQINSNRNEILKSDNKKYSILASIFNCFYERKALSLPKQTIFDYIRKDAIKNKGKMIVSFVINGTNSMQIIDENNYIKKTSNILSKNRCLVIDNNNNISIDMNFINAHENLINRNLFGNNGKVFNSSIKLTKINKPKTARKENNLKKENAKAKIEAGYLSQDDYEIEILESEQDEDLNHENNNEKSNEREIENDTNMIQFKGQENESKNSKGSKNSKSSQNSKGSKNTKGSKGSKENKDGNDSKKENIISQSMINNSNESDKKKINEVAEEEDDEEENEEEEGGEGEE